MGQKCCVPFNTGVSLKDGFLKETRAQNGRLFPVHSAHNRLTCSSIISNIMGLTSQIRTIFG